MGKFLLISSILFFVVLVTGIPHAAISPTTPLIPETGTRGTDKQIVSKVSEEKIEPSNKIPVQLQIPKIKLAAHIVGLGVNEKGEMDVPSGLTKDIGWYEHGTIPGSTGSAVLDAHVFAGFKDLRYVLPGDDIYITSEDGKQLHFKVTDSMVYEKDKVPRDILFNRTDGKYLHLITCAKTFSKKLNTYTHRLVVYATLVET